MSHFTDEELYSKFPSAINSAFAELYKRHSGPLFRFVFRFTANAEVTEEVLHDVFLELLGGKFVDGDGASLKSWLYTVAKNKSLNRIRKNTREVMSESLVSLAPSEIDLEFTAMTKNLLEKLVGVERTLPAELQQTWQLRKDGHDHHEIARRLDIPVGTVKSRFSRLVTYLKKEFENEN